MFHENKTCKFDKPTMTFGLMVNAKACKGFHTIATMEGSQCKVFKQH